MLQCSIDFAVPRPILRCVANRMPSGHAGSFDTGHPGPEKNNATRRRRRSAADSRARSMIIVHVLTRLLRAGSEENTLATCRAQAAAGHQVILMHGREFDAT